MSEFVVVDASVAFHLMPFEVANALHRRVLPGELSVEDSARMIARLLGSRLELHQTAGLHDISWALP